MRSGVICYRTFPVTAQLAMPCEMTHPAGGRLVAGKKLAACGGFVGKDDAFP
jgi:hypothetical protein